MKKYILFLLSLLSYSATAQVGINANGTAPASAAMLDVSSTNKGVLIPRMTTTQKNAIQNPVEGLMVYDTDVKQFSYCLAVFAGTAVNCQWVNFGNTQVPPTSWNVNGNDISSSNSGKVGIGVVNPTLGKLQVVESNPNSPVYSAIWANNTSNGNGITGNAFNSGIGVWGISGTGTGVEGRTTGSNSNSYGIFGNATGSGTGGYFYSASGNALITGNGNVGIGTNSPMAKLDVAGIIKIADGTQGIGKILTSDANGLSSWQAAGWAINGNSGNELKNTNSGGFWSAAATGLDFNTTNSTNPPTAPVGSSGTRLMWIPSRSAFRVGTIYDDGSNGGSNWDGSKIGLFSFATGLNTTASGRISTAFGNFTSAIGNASTAMGNITTASGVAATATGNSTYATGDFSTAMGSYGSTNSHTGSFIIHDNINENIFGITSNSLDNQMIMKFDGGFGFYSGGASDASMGFEKTRGLTVYGKGINTYGGGNIYTENGGKIGVNTATPNSSLQVNGSISMPYIAVSNDYIPSEQDYTIIVNLQNDANKVININLPSPLLATGRIYNIKIIQSPGANTNYCMYDRERFGLEFNNIPSVSAKGYAAIKDYNGSLITCLFEYSSYSFISPILDPTNIYSLNQDKRYSSSRTSISIQSIGNRWIVIAENFSICQYKY